MENLTLLRDIVTIGLWWVMAGDVAATSSFPTFAQKSPKYLKTFDARKAVPVLVSTDFTHFCVRDANGMVPVAMRACKVEFQ